jgi:acyl carrier protein
MADELLSAVCAELRDEFDLDGYVPDSSDDLAGLPGSESVRLLRVAARLERQFNVQFEDEGIFGVSTVGGLVDLLAESISRAEAS